MAEHKDARLIIIDTLQKVREVGGDKFSYASDYEIVTKLKAFSDKYGICFLAVHHTRKMESSDSFDVISGTNGLLGAADGAFVMQKEKRTDSLSIILSANSLTAFVSHIFPSGDKLSGSSLVIISFLSFGEIKRSKTGHLLGIMMEILL